MSKNTEPKPKKGKCTWTEQSPPVSLNVKRNDKKRKVKYNLTDKYSFKISNEQLMMLKNLNYKKQAEQILQRKNVWLTFYDPSLNYLRSSSHISYNKMSA